MRQFGVYRNLSPLSREAPFILVLQSHHLDALESVIAAPLRRDKRYLLSQIDVPIVIRGEALVVAVAEMAAIEKSAFGPLVQDAGAHEDEIRRALDRLFTGF